MKRRQCDQRRRRKSGLRGGEVVMGQITWGLIGKELGWHSKRAGNCARIISRRVTPSDTSQRDNSDCCPEAKKGIEESS